MSEDIAARIAAQNVEFDAVKELAKQWRRIELTPVVDDDYPSVRFDYERAVRTFLDAANANRGCARSESAPTPGAKIAMRLKQQRDECAEALRGLVAVVESNFPMPAGVHPGSPLDKARKALADVPTYEQQLRNIFEGMADEK